MKKLWSILLSVILVLGMSTSVFAADNSPLIVDKNAKGSLTLYKYEVKSPEPMPTGKPSGTTITPAPDKENIVLLDGVTFELTKVEDLNGNPVEGATPVSATTGDKTENFTTGQVKWIGWNWVNIKYTKPVYRRMYPV